MVAVEGEAMEVDGSMLARAGNFPPAAKGSAGYCSFAKKCLLLWCCGLRPAADIPESVFCAVLI